jgi:hypothetical protein
MSASGAARSASSKLPRCSAQDLERVEREVGMAAARAVVAAMAPAAPMAAAAAVRAPR